LKAGYFVAATSSLHFIEMFCLGFAFTCENMLTKFNNTLEIFSSEKVITSTVRLRHKLVRVLYKDRISCVRTRKIGLLNVS